MRKSDENNASAGSGVTLGATADLTAVSGAQPVFRSTNADQHRTLLSAGSFLRARFSHNPCSFTPHPRTQLRRALLGTVAAGALFFSYGRNPAHAGPDECVISGGDTIATCQGDQSAGLKYFNAGYSTVNVNGLTADAGGISVFEGANALDINVDTGVYSINTASDGILGVTSNFDLSIKSTSDITTDFGGGIIGVVDGDGDVSIESTGDITAREDGISGDVRGTGDVSIKSTGDITTVFFGYGISGVVFGDGDVSIESTGDITAALGGGGIYGLVGGDGDVSIESTGDITAARNGISGDVLGTGDVSIKSTGDVTALANGEHGIFARTGGGDITVTIGGGTVTGGGGTGVGVYIADGATTATINNAGILQSDSGIALQGGDGADNLTNTGTLIGEVNLNGGSDSVELGAGGTHSAATFDGGDGTDTFRLADSSATSGALASNSIDGNSISDFEIFEQTGGSWTLSGTSDFASSTTISGGDLTVTGTLDSGDVTVLSGAALTVSGNVYASGDINNAGSSDVSGNFFAEGDFSNSGTLEVSGVVSGVAFTNAAGGSLNFAGGTVASMNGFTNDGSIEIGGAGAIGTGAVIGDLTQSSTGTLAIDVDGDAGTVDVLTVSGKATLAGKVLPSVTGAVASGDQFVFVNAAGGASAAGLSVDDTVGFDFEVSASGTTAVLTIAEVIQILDIIEKLQPSAITRNQSSVASYLDALTANNGTSARLTALLNTLRNLPNAAALVAALNELIPSNITGGLDAAVLGSHIFASAGMSCGVAGGGSYSVVSEGQCTWAKVTGRTKHHDATSNALEFSDRSGGVSGGAQFALGQELRVGFAANYETGETSVKSLSQSESDRAQLGLIVKNRWGGTTLAAAFTGGLGWVDSDRYIRIDGFEATARSDQEISFAGFKLRAAHLIEMGRFGGNGSWYLRPQADFNANYVKIDDYRERGAGVLNLVISGNSENVFSVSPGLEIGAEMQIGGNTVIRPWLRGGGTFFDDASSTLSATFQGAPSGITPFQFTTKLDTSYADVAAGVNVLWENGVELRLNYDGRFSDNSQEHSGGAKLGVKF